MSDGTSPSWLRGHLPVLAWLVLVWVLLWGTWSWANLLTGIVVGLLVMVLLPLPPVVGGLRVHPRPLLTFLGHFTADLVGSAVQVAWQAVRPGPPRRGAIIRVQLRVDSDLLLTMIAEALTLVPGSLVLDLDRERCSLAVHLLQARDLADVERQRVAVLAMEDRLVRALGSAEDIAALERDRNRDLAPDLTRERGAT